MATNRCIWGPGWSEIHSHSYGFCEAQLQVCMGEPAPSRNDEVFSARQGLVAPPREQTVTPASRRNFRNSSSLSLAYRAVASAFVK
jgi:hypothetical protein